jgi:hypothetical protein
VLVALLVIVVVVGGGGGVEGGDDASYQGLWRNRGGRGRDNVQEVSIKSPGLTFRCQ